MKIFRPIAHFGILGILICIYACQPSAKQEAESSTPPSITFTTSSEEALDLFKKGLALFDIGNGRDAREYFSEAIQKDPDFMIAYAYRAMTMVSPEEFTRDVEKAGSLKAKANDWEKGVYEYLNAGRSNDSDKQMEIARNMVEQYPDAARPEIWIGFAYSSRNEDLSARKHFQNAVEKQPEWVGGYFALMNSYIFNEPREPVKSIDAGKKVVEIMPDYASAHIALGDAYRANNDLASAKNAYSKAIDLDPDNALGYIKRGHVNSYLGNFEEARNDYKTSRPKDDYAGYNIAFEGFTYLYEGDYKSALNWINEQAANLESIGLSGSRLVTSQKTCIDQCVYIALHYDDNEHMKALIEKGKPMAEKIGTYIATDEGKAKQTANVVFWEALSAILDKDYEGAASKAEEMKTLLEPINDPTKLEDYHFVHGLVQLDQGNYQEAVRHLEQANKNNQYHKYKLAMAYKGMGENEKSVNILKGIENFNFNSVDYAIIRNEIKNMLSESV